MSGAEVNIGAAAARCEWCGREIVARNRNWVTGIRTFATPGLDVNVAETDHMIEVEWVR